MAEQLVIAINADLCMNGERKQKQNQDIAQEMDQYVITLYVTHCKSNDYNRYTIQYHL